MGPIVSRASSTGIARTAPFPAAWLAALAASATVGAAPSTPWKIPEARLSARRR
jgi:hypothetical protein